MEKKELECGMYVKLRNGSICIVQYEQGLLVDVKDGTYVNLRYYNDDLTTAEITRGLDVVVVYEDYKMENVLWERPKELLTKEENEWLQAVIKPFKDKILTITYTSDGIEIELKDGDICILPQYHNLPFKISRLERNREYTLKELGLED